MQHVRTDNRHVEVRGLVPPTSSTRTRPVQSWPLISGSGRSIIFLNLIRGVPGTLPAPVDDLAISPT